MTQSAGNWYGSPGNPPPKAMLQYVDVSGASYTLTFDAVTGEDWDEAATITEHPVETGANIADHVRVQLIKVSLKVYISNEPIGVASDSGQGANQPSPTSVQLPVPGVSWTKASGQSITYPTWKNPILARSLVQLGGGALGSLAGGAVGHGVAIGTASAVAAELLAGLLLPAKEVDVTQGVDSGLSPVAYPAPVATLNMFGSNVDYVAQMHTALCELKDSAQLFTVVGTKKSLYPMAIESLSFSRSKDTGSGENITIALKEMRIVSTSLVPSPIPNLPAGGAKPPSNHGGQDPAPAPAVSAASALVAAAGALGKNISSVLPSVFGGGVP